MAEDWQAPPAIAAFADLDHDRRARRGYAEAVYSPGKTNEQLAVIAQEVAAAGSPTLFTRITAAQAAIVVGHLPDAVFHDDAGLVVWPARPPAPEGGQVLVVAAGTADLPAAREALLTVLHLGRAAELIPDAGVAGIHRILGQLDRLRQARVIVVVAGMDGALPSVVAGLVEVPVVALPTSVGYGASFGGLAALLGMLNGCAPGIAVVNIDNGYGAGHLAAQIAAP